MLIWPTNLRNISWNAHIQNSVISLPLLQTPGHSKHENTHSTLWNSFSPPRILISLKQTNKKPKPNKLLYPEELLQITGMGFLPVALLRSSEGNSSPHLPKCLLDIFWKWIYFVYMTVLDFKFSSKWLYCFLKQMTEPQKSSILKCL